MSAGRLYDRIGTTATAKVKYILPKGVVCVVSEKSLLYWPPEDEQDEQTSNKDMIPSEDELTSDDNLASPDDPD